MTIRVPAEVNFRNQISIQTSKYTDHFNLTILGNVEIMVEKYSDVSDVEDDKLLEYGKLVRSHFMRNKEVLKSKLSPETRKKIIEVNKLLGKWLKSARAEYRRRQNN